jgi:hypothetical protein
MTAMTASVERVISKDGECEVRFAQLTGLPAYTYTPTNNTGATIKVIACKDDSTVYDAVTASVSSGIVTIDASGSTTTAYSLTYALYR